ncbi:MAG: ATP-binding protein [bacterium]|jgi:DNA replication protein DnaC
MACEKCGGSGWIIFEREGISGAQPCDCVPSTSVEDLEEAARIPPHYRSASFDNFSAFNESYQFILVKLAAYVREFPAGLKKPGLLMIGSTGTGKTHLAVAVLRKLIAKGFQGLFFDYMNLLERIRAGWNEQANAADRDAYQSCLDADVLLLDDVGSHRVSEFVEDTVTGIVTYRCNHEKPLIVTTNIPDPDAGFNLLQRSASGRTEYQTSLADRIGARARSRLFEMCEVIRMPDTGDYRLRKQR